jgi:hypothetical protein
MTAAVGIEASRQTMRREYIQQPLERRDGAFLLDQKARVDRARSVIHRHDQIEHRLPIQPGRTRPILVQHHARARFALALAAVRAPSLRTIDQTRRVQLRLDPGVTPPKIMVANKMFVKMLHVPSAVMTPVELQHQPQIPRRHPLR